MRRIRNDLTGKRFGRWTVIKLHNEEWRQVSAQRMCIRYWLCRCDCGVEKPVHRQLLILKKSTSCGCYQREKSHNQFSIPGTAFKKLLLMYKRSARHRKVSWALSDDVFKKLVTSPCYYTGNLPSSKIYAKSGEEFIYNGIDRLDSSLGYTLENCVPCCSKVNRMKNNVPYNEFISLCKAISERF